MGLVRRLQDTTTGGTDLSRRIPQKGLATTEEKYRMLVQRLASSGLNPHAFVKKAELCDSTGVARGAVRNATCGKGTST